MHILNNGMRCAYSDCVEQHEVAKQDEDGNEIEAVTCSSCRKFRGLDNIQGDNMSKYPKVYFLEENCSVRFARYDNNAIAIQLICEDGSPMATATVNLAEVPPPGHVFVKDHSENTGMLAALIKAGYVEDTGKRIPSGFVTVPLAKLLIQP
jgi:hypothetical protein